MHENCYFVVPVNILTPICACPGLLGPHDTQLCVLIIIFSNTLKLTFLVQVSIVAKYSGLK